MSPDEAAVFICEQSPTVLWGIDTRRELLQYLRSAGRSLSPAVGEQLTDKILEGPPREQFRAEISEEEFLEIRDRSVYLRLAKINRAACY
jgi:hypothetical protein